MAQGLARYCPRPLRPVLRPIVRAGRRWAQGSAGLDLGSPAEPAAPVRVHAPHALLPASEPIRDQIPDDLCESLDIHPDAMRRIRMTLGCADCDVFPKMPRAGEVLDGPSGRYQVMHNGVKVAEDCYYGRWMTELIRRLRGHHEPQEERAFHEILRHVPPGGTMVELGSYWAYYSLWFQHQIPGARNYLIEPDPHNLETGRQNFALNGAVGEFFLYSIGRQSALPAPFLCESEGTTRPIPMTSVDAFLKHAGIAHVDVLLSDIQGAEVDMLEGAVDSIAEDRIRFLIVSTHHHSISRDPLTHQKCLGFLRDRGAHILCEHSVSESYSGDGLIVASFRPEDQRLPAIAISRNSPSNSLFRELEYDLDDAWREIRRLGGTSR